MKKITIKREPLQTIINIIIDANNMDLDRRERAALNYLKKKLKDTEGHS